MAMISLDDIEIQIPDQPQPRRFALQECGGADGAPGPLAPPRRLDSQAMRWSYVLRNRERWLGRGGAAQAHEDDAAQTLREFGLDDAALAAIAAAPLVVVRMPYASERQGWAGRIFPWEYVIAAATRQLRRVSGQHCTVLREFMHKGAPRWRPAGPKLSMLFVQSAPGGLRTAEDFAPERERMRRALPGSDFQVLTDPTLAQLSEKIGEMRPDLIHLSGFDNASGLAEWRELAAPSDEIEIDGEGERMRLRDARSSERANADGMLLAGQGTRVALVGALPLAQALTAGGRHCAYFIGASLGSSAARTAALMVAERAALSAVGFQDHVDNALLDFFFDLFYGQLARQPWDAPLAFQQAWLRARQEPDATRATGIAFWAGAPLIRAGHPPAPAQPALGAAADDIEPFLRCVVEKELNYAVLHNNGSLFQTLAIERGKAGERDWLSLEVELHVGVEQARFLGRFRPDRPHLDIADKVLLPLTATLLRSVKEAVYSTLVVQFSWNDRLISRETYRIRLLPVDQWRDNVKDGRWLPSFVLPRDEAVLKAVEQARRYVRVLRDNPSAGFEGYQAAPDTSEDALREVDLQVQAVWATLLNDWELGYINPPPAYSSALDSQRLRTPSAVLANRAGTCIDLALLFAACLELIDIHPVIFLLNGHALPGYWRHQSFRADYLAMRETPAPTQPSAGLVEPGILQRSPWQAVGPMAYEEARHLIQQRQLVPIETVRLTEHCGFVEAIEAGVAALAVPTDFDSLLDLVSARVQGITPLPIYGGPA